MPKFPSAMFPVLLMLLAITAQADDRDAPVARVDLVQSADALREHRRMVGNARAQARRQGIIQSAPQLFVYYGDATAVYHMHGYQRGFERVLDSAFRRGSRVRDMVALSALLDNARTPAGETVRASQWPSADIIIVEYVEHGCQSCEQVASDLNAWLQQREAERALWLRIDLDAR